MRGGLLGEDVLLQLLKEFQVNTKQLVRGSYPYLKLGHVPLEVGELLLVGDGVLLESGQGRLVLLLQLTLLLDLSRYKFKSGLAKEEGNKIYEF